MQEKTYQVLFICTGNSARSILAEALLNDMGGTRFRAYSAGSFPSGTVHPLALHTLRALRLPAEGFRSKSWSEFATPSPLKLDFVFTVCDKAAGETCPIWPGQPLTAHWGVPDPAAAQGTDELKAKHFLDAAVTLKRRLELMLCLPVEQLDRLSLQQRLDDVGKR